MYHFAPTCQWKIRSRSRRVPALPPERCVNATARIPGAKVPRRSSPSARAASADLVAPPPARIAPAAIQHVHVRPKVAAKNRRSGEITGPSFFDDLVLALDESARIRARRNVAQAHVAPDRTEERNSAAEDDRDPVDHDPVDQPRVEEALDGDSAVHVEVPRPALLQAGGDFAWTARHVLRGRCGERRKFAGGPTRQDDDRLLSVRPMSEGQDLLESVPPDHDHIDGRKERAK